MGYNLSISVVQRWKNYLLLIHKHLVEEKKDSISFAKEGIGETLFYHLQEALRAAEHHNLPKVGGLRRIVKVKKERDSIVVIKVEKIDRTVVVEEKPIDQFMVAEVIIGIKDDDINYEILFPNIPDDAIILGDIMAFCEGARYEMIKMDKGISVKRII